MSDDIYKSVLKSLENKYKDELLKEDDICIDDAEETEAMFKKLGKTEKINLFSLSEIPIPEWDELRVSRVSKFSDNRWVFSQEGPFYKSSADIIWDYKLKDGVSLLSPENKNLLYLLKGILFYNLPHNAIFSKIRSYNSVKSILKDIKYLGEFLYKKNIFIDTQGNGLFSKVSVLTEENFHEFLENKNPHVKYGFARAVINWQTLSENQLLPIEYRIGFEPINKKIFEAVKKEVYENAGTYQPISLECLSFLVPHCIDIIENLSDDIIFAYKSLIPVITSKEAQNFNWEDALYLLEERKTTLWDMENFSYNESGRYIHKQKLKKIIRNHQNWTRISKKPKLDSASTNEVLNVAKQIGIDIESLDRTIRYNLHRIRSYVQTLATTLRTACVVVVLLTTGMRASELLSIEVGKCWLEEGTNDDYKLEFTVYKTSDSSTGTIVELPVPKIVFSAISCLEKLTEDAREYGNSKKLMVGITVNYGNEINDRAIARALHNWCIDLDIEHIHPHQFRKTLAMFAIYQDPRNIGLIKRLFSHKSLAMTLAYIVKMPGMTDEFKLAVIQQNKELLASLLSALDKDVIGGKAGVRIKEAIKGSQMFQARLNDDGWENLDQYVDTLLDEGLRLLHRTKFGAICTNTHSPLTHLGPESCDCNVVDCDYAVFLEESIGDLENDIRFHTELLKHPYVGEDQKRFSERQIINCAERLLELRGKDYVMEKYPGLLELGA